MDLKESMFEVVKFVRGWFLKVLVFGVGTERKAGKEGASVLTLFGGQMGVWRGGG